MKRPVFRVVAMALAFLVLAELLDFPWWATVVLVVVTAILAAPSPVWLENRVNRARRRAGL